MANLGIIPPKKAKDLEKKEVLTKIFIFEYKGSQCAERILNKTAKCNNETFAGLKLMLQGFRIYFV